jgi:hypothetical protein
MVVLMTWAAFCGIAWTFAITYWHIGLLHRRQTAFLGSIIVGNGINYSLVKLARYQEEREKGVDPLHALIVASSATFPGNDRLQHHHQRGFGVLILTQIKGFSHFGFIGGLGHDPLHGGELLGAARLHADLGGNLAGGSANPARQGSTSPSWRLWPTIWFPGPAGSSRSAR